jgi:alanine racemase
VIRSTVAHVDLAALKANFRAIQEFLSQSHAARAFTAREAAHTGTPRTSSESGTTPGIIAVVKANAYGHGSQRVSLALEEAGATMLAVADIEEGIVLRQGGVRVPILVFGALSVSDLDGLFEFSLTPTISTPSAARAVQGAAAKRNTVIPFHLKWTRA